LLPVPTPAAVSFVDYTAVIVVTLIITVVTLALEFAKEAEVRVTQVYVVEFLFFFIVMSVFNVLTALSAFQIILSKELLPLANLPTKWFIASGAGVFAVQAVAIQINVSFWGAGIATLQKWRDDAKTYVADAIRNHDGRHQAALLSQIQRLVADEGPTAEKRVNSWIMAALGADQLRKIEDRALALTVDSVQYKLQQLLLKKPEFINGILEESKERNAK